VNEAGGMEVPDLRRAPAERLAAAVLPASPLVWTAAEIMHWTGRPGVTVTALAAAALSGVTWGATARNGGDSSLPAWTAVVGAWVTIADALGPLRWLPVAPLTVAWAVIALAASHAAHRHQSVMDAREWREAKADWLGRSRDWGLGGSHLLDFRRTRLGELYEISTKGTGHRASHFVRREQGQNPIEEFIAEAEDLAVNRVRVMGHGLAGRIMISIRRIDPWEGVLLHPLVCDEHEIELPETRSILDEALVGQDPETGVPLTIPLCDENGAKRVSATANSGGGKGVLEDDLFEHVTACDDAVAVHLNLSVKGYEDEQSWGPACHLTAYGPGQRDRAVKIVQKLGEIIEWRARNFKRGTYVPSRQHPAFIVFADESDTATAAVQDGLNMIATKGRSHGVGYVHLGQRNTREYTHPKARSQDNVMCTGMVRSVGEDRHAGTGTGPSMATYGEGKPGVWKIERLGGGMHVGRTWVFSASPAKHGAEVERIAAERAFGQPELSGACRAYLGEEYEELLRTEVFARWARANGHADPEPEAETGDEAGDDGILAAAAPPPATMAEAPAAAAAGTVITEEEDPLRRWEMNMGDRERAMLDGIAAKLGGARRIITEISERPARPQVPAEVRAAQVAEDWRDVGTEAVIPEGARARMLEMLAAPPSAANARGRTADPWGGTTIRAVATEFGVSKWIARTWLEKLRGEGVAYVAGTRATARWKLFAATPPGPGGPPEAGDAESPPGA
jgi:hypothetical protein